MSAEVRWGWGGWGVEASARARARASRVVLGGRQGRRDRRARPAHRPARAAPPSCRPDLHALRAHAPVPSPSPPLARTWPPHNVRVTGVALPPGRHGGARPARQHPQPGVTVAARGRRRRRRRAAVKAVHLRPSHESAAVRQYGGCCTPCGTARGDQGGPLRRCERLRVRVELRGRRSRESSLQAWPPKNLPGG
jgi:hypothetical protein